MAMIQNAEKAVDLVMAKEHRLNRLKQLHTNGDHVLNISKTHIGGKRIQQLQPPSENRPVKKLKMTSPSSSDAMVVEAWRRQVHQQIFGDFDDDDVDDSIIKVAGKDQKTEPSFGEQRDDLGKSDDVQSILRDVVKGPAANFGSLKPEHVNGNKVAAIIPEEKSSGSQKQGKITGKKLVTKTSAKNLFGHGKQGNRVLGENVVAEIQGDRTNDKIRDQIREDLAKSLSKVATEIDEKGEEAGKVLSCDPLYVAAMVETELFKAWGSCGRANKAKYRSVMFNLKDNKNPDFRKKVLLGEFTPESISELTPKDMASQARKLEDEQIRGLPKFNREIRPPPELKGEGNPELQCRRCEFSATTYSQMQTRSADEPMTILVHCHNCDNNWKV
ncbi:OLC1v1021911C1 [Oldenlandia corymbosa var. corymbosa]|uniref:OLC1v1021911C1 n=1 Tax=Oldenlandia corymbosa var. corymbosa TaxID=529605 RepID=A0AAV1BWX0_OLDCO|nr:OLC1v1021911C1 [Oldenlandia corymbosa var. corymbosa]